MAENVIDQVNTNSYFQHQNELPLHLSIRCNHLAMVRFLIEHGSDVNMLNRRGFYPLHYACMYLVNKEIVEFLIESGANINAYSLPGQSPGQTPLLMAINSNSLELVKVLVEAGADLELKDQDEGFSPLHLACKHPDGLKIAEYLLKKGANLETRNLLGYTPMTTCIIENYSINTGIIKCLLKYGADPNEANAFGMAPLLATIRRSSDHLGECVEAVQTLIDHGCDVNDREFRQSFGETALNLSIDRNQDSITEVLIRNGADASVKNLRSETPLVNLLRDRKYDLAKQAAATIPIIEDDEMFPTYLSESYHNNCDLVNTAQLQNFLCNNKPLFPRLMHLCRCSFRKWHGRFADRTIDKLNLPVIIRLYLNLKQL